MKSVVYFFWLPFFLLACQSSPTPEAEVAPSALSILQGATDTSRTVITIFAPKNQPIDVSIHLDVTVLQRPTLTEKLWDNSDMKMVTFELRGLAPGANYLLKVLDDRGSVLDIRHFKTFSKELKNPSIAVISCLDDSYQDLQKMQWNEVWSQKPDALFLIGDNVYADIQAHKEKREVTTDDILKRYSQTRQSLQLYRQPQLIPVFATWDDHDYGKNDADATFPHKEFARETFDAFFPMSLNKVTSDGPGVATSFKIDRQVFVFFDDRYFRSPRGDDSQQTHFGKDQEEWFFKLLRKEKGPFWLVSGDQFFGGYHPFESYEGNHPRSFKKFINRLKKAKRTIVFVSGDRHLAEVMRIPAKELGYTTYEFTSSGLHARMFAGALEKAPNPRGIFGKDGTPNFLMIRSFAPTPRRLLLETTFLGPSSQPLHQQTYEVAR